MLSLKPRPSFNRPSICRRPDSHTCFFLFSFVYFEMSLFPSIFCTIIDVFSLCGEHVVCSFLPGVFLYLVTTSWILKPAYLGIQSINQFNQQTSGCMAGLFSVLYNQHECGESAG